MRFLRGREEPMNDVVHQLEAGLAEAEERLAELEHEAKLAIVREKKQGADAELEEARARFEPLHARRFAISRGERKALGKAEALMRTAQEKLRPLEERERELLARKAALEEAGREWPSPDGGTRLEPTGEKGVGLAP
jgi:hypothetical protein